MRTLADIEWDMASVLVRTDYSDEPAWQRAAAAATAVYGAEGFQADFISIEDADWSGVTESAVRQQAAADGFRSRRSSWWTIMPWRPRTRCW